MSFRSSFGTVCTFCDQPPQKAGEYCGDGGLEHCTFCFIPETHAANPCLMKAHRFVAGHNFQIRTQKSPSGLPPGPHVR